MVTLFIFHILLIYCKLHHLLRSSLFFYFKGFLKDIAVLLLHALEKIYMPVFFCSSSSVLLHFDNNISNLFMNNGVLRQ